MSAGGVGRRESLVGRALRVGRADNADTVVDEVNPNVPDVDPVGVRNTGVWKDAPFVVDKVPAALKEQPVGGRTGPRRLKQVFHAATELAPSRVRFPRQTSGVELLDVVLVPVPLPVVRRVNPVLP